MKVLYISWLPFLFLNIIFTLNGSTGSLEEEGASWSLGCAGSLEEEGASWSLGCAGSLREEGAGR